MKRLHGKQDKGIGFTSERTKLRMINRLQAQGIRDETVLAAMRQVPRHVFVDEALASRAYEDTALPIGFKQTISQPYIVARMAELMLAHFDAQDRKPHTVLEIGTGCGYQAVVLSQVVDKVYSIERIEGLYKKARRTINDLRLSIYLRHGDGFAGLPLHAPFDAIILAAAPEHIPEALMSQLADGGVLLAPIGGVMQELVQVTRNSQRSDEFEQQVIEPANFVPFLRGTS